MDFDENRPTSSMVLGMIMGARETKSARNERIRIVVFQNAPHNLNRASIGGDTG